jgi:aspartate racemase
MKKLGLIGGISWFTSADYYKYINEGVNQRLGALNFAPCIMHSFSMEDIKKHMDAGDYDTVRNLFCDASLHMKQGGAEGIVICANTMHMFADDIEQRTGLPVIHMVDATAKAILGQNLRKVALLGTLPTMNLSFYKDKLAKYGIETVLPTEGDKEYIHASIFAELSRGIFTAETKARYISIINEMVANGAEGIILGCTDIPPLIAQEDVSVPVFDTTRLHAEAVVEFCLG